MAERLFLKLGGSLLTDKTEPEAVRHQVLARTAAEIAAALSQRPDLELVIGHGSGSFGHVVAAKHGTRDGVSGIRAWRGYAEVADAAARLNSRVRALLLEAGVPVLSLPPSASTRCRDGVLESMAVEPFEAALDAGLVPLTFGDVAFDAVRGGTIVSTEEVLAHLAPVLRPRWFFLAGEVPGVLDEANEIIPHITGTTLSRIEPALGGSRGADVTGGMVSKVRAMVDLTTTYPALGVRIFSALEPGELGALLRNPQRDVGTLITAV